MRLVLYLWGSNTEDKIKKNLIELGHEVTVFARICEHYTKDLGFAQELINYIHEFNSEGIISYDYYPIISMVCNVAGIIYYSWVYDSPHYTLFAKTSAYPCNKIGCFDRALVKRLNSLGIDTVFHIPLGVDWRSCTEKNSIDENNVANKGYEDKKYVCDVSFVGSLYTGEYNYYDILCNDKQLREMADKIIEKQCFEYRKDYIEDFFKDNNGKSYNSSIENKVSNIIECANLFPGNEYIEDIEYIFNSHFLEKKVTVEERRRLLTMVAETGCDFRLYTGSDLCGLPKLKKKCRGYVNYHKDMPKVFANSRINLNISLRSIKTGIPLRALDIMACGGFLLSNYQDEIVEYFREGKEVALFYDIDDCIEKIKYYLKHEDERMIIAEAGRQAVQEKFNIKDQLRKLLEWHN